MLDLSVHLAYTDFMTKIVYEPDRRRPGFTGIGIMGETAEAVQREIDIIMRRTETMYGKSFKCEFTWPRQCNDEFIALGYVEVLQ